jgi:hypothetical protein
VTDADPAGAGPLDGTTASIVLRTKGAVSQGQDGAAGTIHDKMADALALDPPAAGASAADASGADAGATGPGAIDPGTIDPGAAALQAGDQQTAETSAAGAARLLPAAGGVPTSVTSQVAPALVSAAQGGGVGGRLSISITPEQLGQVHITVERSVDGTTSIHVAAEQLGTLNILRHDQADLTRALDQAGVGQDGHSLSFSWDGGGGAAQGRDAPPGQHQAAHVSRSYAAEPAAIPSIAATARGGIDLTA